MHLLTCTANYYLKQVVDKFQFDIFVFYFSRTCKFNSSLDSTMALEVSKIK